MPIQPVALLPNRGQNRIWTDMAAIDDEAVVECSYNRNKLACIEEADGTAAVP